MRLIVSILIAVSFASACASTGETSQRTLGVEEASFAPSLTLVEKLSPLDLPSELDSLGKSSDTEKTPRPAGSKEVVSAAGVSPTSVVSETWGAPRLYDPNNDPKDPANDACARLADETAFGAGRAINTELIGRSSQGAPLLVEHYGSNTGPQILVVGQVHGNECSPALFVKSVRALNPTSWGIYLLPTLNPDGLKTLERRASGVDLNRDGLELSSPESKALLDFTASRDLYLTIHLHSPNGWVGYHGTERAIGLAKALSSVATLGFLRGAGSGRGFLWEGQAKRVQGHQSVLVELPAVFQQEAPFAPERMQRDLEEVSLMVGRMTKAMLEYMNQESITQVAASVTQ